MGSNWKDLGGDDDEEEAEEGEDYESDDEEIYLTARFAKTYGLVRI